MVIENRAALQEARDAFLGQIDHQTKKIYVCGGTGCVAGGSMEIFEKLQKLIEERGIKCQVKLEKEEEGNHVGLKTVSYTHLDVYKRQAILIPTVENRFVFFKRNITNILKIPPARE